MKNEREESCVFTLTCRFFQAAQARYGLGDAGYCRLLCPCDHGGQRGYIPRKNQLQFLQKYPGWSYASTFSWHVYYHHSGRDNGRQRIWVRYLEESLDPPFRACPFYSQQMADHAYKSLSCVSRSDDPGRNRRSDTSNSDASDRPPYAPCALYAAYLDPDANADAHHCRFNGYPGSCGLALKRGRHRVWSLLVYSGCSSGRVRADGQRWLCHHHHTDPDDWPAPKSRRRPVTWTITLFNGWPARSTPPLNRDYLSGCAFHPGNHLL